jgi:hypothetical protein
MIFLCLLMPIAVVAQRDWIPLYNGTNLDGWEHVGPGEMVVEDGLIKTVGGMGLLWYTGGKLSDVIIRVVYKGAEDNNSGVFIRIPQKPAEPWMPVYEGFEVQIDDTEDDYHVTGVLYSFTRARARAGRAGWNIMEITLDGDRTIVHVNGVLVTDYSAGDDVPPKKVWYEPNRGPRVREGYVGLQNHGKDDVVFFKEISYKPLNNDG